MSESNEEVENVISVQEDNFHSPEFLRSLALENDFRNSSAVVTAVLWLAAEVRELRLTVKKRIEG